MAFLSDLSFLSFIRLLISSLFVISYGKPSTHKMILIYSLMYLLYMWLGVLSTVHVLLTKAWFFGTMQNGASPMCTFNDFLSKVNIAPLWPSMSGIYIYFGSGHAHNCCPPQN